MLDELRETLEAKVWRNSDPPPVVDFKLYFENNDEETCIAPNQWGEGRPSVAAMYERFQEIARKREVASVLVGLHADWNDEAYSEGYPPAENVHIISSASRSEVEAWVQGLHASDVVKGWPSGQPRDVPETPKGYSVYTVCWD